MDSRKLNQTGRNKVEYFKKEFNNFFWGGKNHLPSTQINFFGTVDLSHNDTAINFWIMSGNKKYESAANNHKCRTT